MKRKLLVVLAVAAACAIAAGAAATLAWHELNSPLALPDEGIVYEVQAGTGMSHIANVLHERGILEHPRLLSAFARVTGDATRIKAGEYRIEPGMTPISFLEQLVAGTVIQHRFTIVEGWTVRDLLRALRANPAIVESDIDLDNLMTAVGQPDVDAEGQFLPDTYNFTKGTRDIEVLKAAHEAMQRELARVWPTRSIGSELDSPYEALILASIIEKETALASERRIIAGVLNRRLARNIKLQTDPTVIYGLGEAFDGNLRREDIARDTPYNTYTRTGLPPTPIALPGVASLEAAVDPAPGDALYFVATGLPDGSHYFSATLEEHNRAVRAYNERMRQRNRQ